VTSTASPDDLFWAFSRVGGEVGYYGFGWLWRLRGLLDSLVGGVGLRRGRRDAEDLRPGEALDFWRVRRVEPAASLLLEAEMKLPGDAWLEWAAEPSPSGATLTQTATFVPRGLFGRLYWYSLVPFHTLIFGAMTRRIAAAAEARGGGSDGVRNNPGGREAMGESNRRKMRFQWRMHKLIWNASGGRLGRNVAGMPVLELETIGRKSGQPRRILITYVECEGAPTIIGTNAGRDADPAWVLNLRSRPAARARWDGRWRGVTAVELDGQDHAKAWEAGVSANPGYEEYRRGLTRAVPIMRLEQR
jgi:deazaflavin-dependent oxidoreductase (nitroreductase family)